MSDEKPTEEEVVETPQEEAPQEDPTEEPTPAVEEPEEGSEEAPEEGEEEDQIDYDADLAERQELRESNKTNAERRLKEKGKLEDEDEEPTDIKEQMREVIREEKIADQEGSAQEALTEILATITDEAERRSTEDHYLHTIKPSGTTRAAIVKDIALARTLANQPKKAKEISELKVAVKNRVNISDDGGSPNQDKPKSNPETWSKEQLADMKKRKITPEDIAKTEEKLKSN